jgi:hypothetical protein
VQAALTATNEHNVQVDGSIIFRNEILGDIDNAISLLRPTEGVGAKLVATVCSPTSTTWRSLLDKVNQLLTQAKNSKTNPSMRVAVRAKAPSTIIRSLGTEDGGSVSNDGCKLNQTFSFEHRVLSHYVYDSGEDMFVPVHSSIERKSTVKLYKGNYRGLIQAETASSGNKPDCGVLFIDPPWNIHEGRKEDERVFTPDEVGMLPLIFSIQVELLVIK